MGLNGILITLFDDATLYYRDVVQRDAWPLIEAVFIVCDILPSPESITDDDQIAKNFPVVSQIYRLAIESIAIEQLTARELGGKFYVKPKDFVRWAMTKGFTLPAPIQEWAKDKKIRRASDKINDNTRKDHKLQIQAAAVILWSTLKAPNQGAIYRHKDIQNLLNSFVYGCDWPRKYLQKTVIQWIREVDPRKGERRGRPFKQNKK